MKLVGLELLADLREKLLDRDRELTVLREERPRPNETKVLGQTHVALAARATGTVMKIPARLRVRTRLRGLWRRLVGSTS
jgi:hypothetical protein